MVQSVRPVRHHAASVPGWALGKLSRRRIQATVPDSLTFLYGLWLDSKSGWHLAHRTILVEGTNCIHVGSLLVRDL